MVVSAGPSASESYVIDKKHTEVRFTYTMGLSTRRGHFTCVDGKMEFDATAPEKTAVAANGVHPRSLTIEKARSRLRSR